MNKPSLDNAVETMVDRLRDAMALVMGTLARDGVDSAKLLDMLRVDPRTSGLFPEKGDVS